MKTNFFTILFVSLLITACNFKNENLTTVAHIDNLVASIMDTSNVYDIVQSPRFSRSDEQYNVVEYAQNDTTRLMVESFKSEKLEFDRQLFYDNNKLLYASEIGYSITDSLESEYVLNTYFLGDGSQINYSNTISSDVFSENYKLTDRTVKIELNKSVNAIKQKGDFEMKFGEFLVMGPQSYLILSNNISKYDIALYIQEGDFLLDELYTKPDKYKGKTVFVNHEFINENGVSKMAYRGGMLIQNN